MKLARRQFGRGSGTNYIRTGNEPRLAVCVCVCVCVCVYHTHTPTDWLGARLARVL